MFVILADRRLKVFADSSLQPHHPVWPTNHGAQDGEGVGLAPRGARLLICKCNQRYYQDVKFREEDRLKTSLEDPKVFICTLSARGFFQMMGKLAQIFMELFMVVLSILVSFLCQQHEGCYAIMLFMCGISSFDQEALNKRHSGLVHRIGCVAIESIHCGQDI
jgi:hypothetical protein